MSRQLPDHRRVPCPSCFEHLPKALVQRPSSVCWEFFVQRLLDECVDERKPLPEATATLFQQSCFESRVQSGEDFGLRTITCGNQYINIELLAQNARHTQQVPTFRRQSREAFADH